MVGISAGYTTRPRKLVASLMPCILAIASAASSLCLAARPIPSCSWPAPTFRDFTTTRMRSLLS